MVLLKKKNLEALKEHDPALYAQAVEFQKRWRDNLDAMPFWKRWFYKILTGL